MLRAFIVIALLAAIVLAQNVARPSPDEQLANVSQLLERGRTSEAERLLRQVIPKPEEEPIQDFGIFTQAGVHDILWAMVGYSYLGT